MPTRANPVVTLFPLLVAGMLAGMSYWLELATRPLATGSDGKLRHDPDFIIEKFEVRRFDPQGSLQHTLIADQMRHYPDDDSTVVLAPRLTYHRMPPTFVSAREARLDSKGKHVELIDAVRVTRAGEAGTPDTVLTTTRLHVFPDDEIARTSVPVTITQGQSHVDGSGLNVDNKTSIYVLEGPVRGVFFVNRASPAEAPPESLPQALPMPKSTSSR
jgi:lipopolysaccharide export system protein LptC